MEDDVWRQQKEESVGGNETAGVSPLQNVTVKNHIFSTRKKDKEVGISMTLLVILTLLDSRLSSERG